MTEKKELTLTASNPRAEHQAIVFPCSIQGEAIEPDREAESQEGIRVRYYVPDEDPFDRIYIDPDKMQHWRDSYKKRGIQSRRLPPVTKI